MTPDFPAVSPVPPTADVIQKAIEFVRGERSIGLSSADPWGPRIIDMFNKYRRDLLEILDSPSPAPSVGELEWREEITRGNLLTWTIWKALSKSAKFEIDAGIGGENSGVASLRVEITELFDSIPAAKSLANSLQRILSGAAEEGEAK